MKSATTCFLSGLKNLVYHSVPFPDFHNIVWHSHHLLLFLLLLQHPGCLWTSHDHLLHYRSGKKLSGLVAKYNTAVLRHIYFLYVLYIYISIGLVSPWSIVSRYYIALPLGWLANICTGYCTKLVIRLSSPVHHSRIWDIFFVLIYVCMHHPYIYTVYQFCESLYTYVGTDCIFFCILHS